MEPSDFYIFVLPLGGLIVILASLVFYTATREEKQEKKLKKLMRTYVKDRLEQEKSFTKELEHLKTLLDDKSIDQETYVRLKQILEINFEQKREETRTQKMERV